MPATYLYLDREAHIKPFLGISAGTKAVGTITYGVPVNGDTVTVNGTTFTKAAALGAAAFSTIAELTALINALANIGATQNGSIITITADAVGEAGNAYTLVIGAGNTGTLSISGATFTGGTSGNTSKDALLDLLNDMATSKLNSMLNVTTLAKHTVSDESVEPQCADDGFTEYYVKDMPILSITSIKQGSLESVYTQDDDYLFRKNILTLNGISSGSKGYDADKVSYVAGYVTYAQNASGTYQGETITFPDDLIEAMMYLVAGMYNKRNNLAVKSFSLQGKTVTFRDQDEFTEFEKILNHYRKTTNTILSI